MDLVSNKNVTASKNLKDRRELMLKNIHKIEAKNGKVYLLFLFNANLKLKTHLSWKGPFSKQQPFNFYISEHNYENINEEELFKTSIVPLQKLDCSAEVFSSPRKRDHKHRKRKIDVERQEQKKKLKERGRINSDKNMELVKPFYGKYFSWLFLIDQISGTNDEANYSPANLENSVLTNFAHSLLEKMSRKGNESSTNTNDHQASNYADPTTESGKKSCK